MIQLKKILFSGLLIFLFNSCGENDEKNKPVPEKKNETKAIKKDTLKVEEVKSISEEEVLAMAKTFIKENKRLFVNESKMDVLKVYKINLNNDKLDDYFIYNLWWANNDGNSYFYYLYDSELNKIVRIKTGNGPASVGRIFNVSSANGKISGEAEVHYVAGDIGNFEKKAKVTFEIIDNKIIFDQASVAALKKAEKKLNLEVEAAYAAMEGDGTEEPIE
jgi:hypothetical protein